MRLFALFSITVVTLAAQSLPAQSLPAQSKDISGTWIAKVQGPMGAMEIVYRLKVDNGRITGTQTLPFGDAPIVDGRIDGDQIEMTVEMESFGNLQRRTVTAKIVGDELHVTPAMPGPPPGGAGPGARPPSAGGASGGTPSPGGIPGPGGGGGGGGMRRMLSGPVIARRGIPTPSYRASSVDYKSLPKIELPQLRDLPSNGLAKTPPMGWNSWNKFRTAIDDKTVREIANAMVSTGMRDAGYLYVNIDDGWQWKRDEKGVLQPNPNFPDMKSLADYVHSKGLKIGIYSSPGPTTCGNFAGSYGHEEIDAKTWAAWGIDYLKYDWCSAARIWKDDDMRAVYQRMGDAIRKTGRPMVYSICQYGRANVGVWGPKVGGNLWRTTFDIRDQWESMVEIGFSQSDLASLAKPGQWNDPDMLEVGNGAMSATEYRTHFSLWALLAAPLLAGNDIRKLDDMSREILLNTEVIAVNQDALGKAGQRVAKKGDTEIWMKPLSNGRYAIGLFNLGATAADIEIAWSELKLPDGARVRDLWRHSDMGRVEGSLKMTTPSHGVVLLEVKP